MDDITRRRLQEELSQQLGRRLAQARGERELSQEELAEAADMSVDVISKLERGLMLRLDLGTYGRPGYFCHPGRVGGYAARRYS